MFISLFLHDCFVNLLVGVFVFVLYTVCTVDMVERVRLRLRLRDREILRERDFCVYVFFV